MKLWIRKLSGFVVAAMLMISLSDKACAAENEDASAAPSSVIAEEEPAALGESGTNPSPASTITDEAVTDTNGAAGSGEVAVEGGATIITDGNGTVTATDQTGPAAATDGDGAGANEAAGTAEIVAEGGAAIITDGNGTVTATGLTGPAAATDGEGAGANEAAGIAEIVAEGGAAIVTDGDGIATTADQTGFAAGSTAAGSSDSVLTTTGESGTGESGADENRKAPAENGSRSVGTSGVQLRSLSSEFEMAPPPDPDVENGSQTNPTENGNENGSVQQQNGESGTEDETPPQNQGTLRARTAEEAVDLRSSEQADLAAFVRDALNGVTGVRELDLDGDRVYLAGAPVKTLGWAVVSVVDKAATERPTIMMQEQFDSTLNEAATIYNKNLDRSKQTIIVLILLILIMGLTAGDRLSRRIVRPLEHMTNRVRSLGGKNLQFRMEEEYRTGDEIEVLAESFSALSAKTLQYVDQVKRVTAEKERIGAELTMANAIQRSQLPRLFPPFPNRHEFNLFATMKPAKEVGGDFYDFFMVDNDHVALVMADVSGKGVPAALFMMVTRMLIKSRLQSGESVAEALTNVNRQLCENNELGYFVTVWLAVLEISTGKGVAVNAGHEHPVLRRSDGKYELVLYRHSLAVAAMDGVRFRQHEFQLCPGDSFFVYTDGVTEATNGEHELFGTDRMLEALNKEPDAEPDQLLKNVMDDIHRFMDGEDQFDDITMMCLKYNGPVE